MPKNTTTNRYIHSEDVSGIPTYNTKTKRRIRQRRWCRGIYVFVGLGIVGVLISMSIHTMLLLNFGEYSSSLSMSPQLISSWSLGTSFPETSQNENATNIAYTISITECDPTTMEGKYLLDGAAVLKHSIHLNSAQTLESGSKYNYTMIAFFYDDNIPTPTTNITSSIKPTNTTATAYATNTTSTSTTNNLKCIPHLQALGYQIYRYTKLPVTLSDIQNEWFRERVQKGGCCQEKEFLKLYAYTLMNYPIVVHLDIDSLLLKPFDSLYDTMMLDVTPPSSKERITSLQGRQEELVRQIKPMWNSTVLHNTDNEKNNEKEESSLFNRSTKATSIDAFFTRDYNMITASYFYKSGKSIKQVGVQGGFLVIKPDLEVYKEYQQLIKYGNFTPNNGWGDKGYGKFYGGVTIQGLVGYYYGELYGVDDSTASHGNTQRHQSPSTGATDHHRGRTSMELNRCYYNQMADSPFQVKDDVTYCRTNQNLTKCQDCRQTSFEDIYSVHFTICQKPWKCIQYARNRTDLCSKFHRRWFQIRWSLEKSWQMDQNPNYEDAVLLPWKNESNGGAWDSNIRRGYCGKDGNGRTYSPIQVPLHL